MNKKVLITYASRTGSTTEIAEEIARTLAERGGQVELIPMQEVKSIAPYSAVIIGSPIRKSKWTHEAMKFVQDHRVELSQKRVATFTVCITLAMSNGEQYRQAVRQWIAPIRTQVKPVSEGLFAGMLDFKKLPLTLDTMKLRLVVALGIFPGNDRRDWKAVRGWAESLDPLLFQ